MPGPRACTWRHRFRRGHNLRNRPEHDVMVGEVKREPVEAVCDRRTGRTARRVLRSEHEMVNEQLGTTLEEVCQQGAPFVGIESVVFADSNPWQFLPPPRQLVA